MPGPAGRVTIKDMPEAAAAPLAEPRPPRKLYRSSDGRWLGGVARGLAGHLGLPVIWVRLVFVGLFMADGLGALLYAAFWFFVPLGVGGVEAQKPPSLVTSETSPDGRRRLVARRPDRGQIVALLLMVVVAMVFVGNVNLRAAPGSTCGPWCSWARASPSSGARRTTRAGPAGPRSAATAVRSPCSGPWPVCCW
jgi:phage shock protein PspC (stress-responsive transcriptional regulator)